MALDVVIKDGAGVNATVNDGSGSIDVTVTAGAEPSGGGGGSAVTLDLGDDGSNESSDLTEIATQNDSNSIATEPSADKLLLDMGQNWPTADDVPDSAVDHDQTTNFVANEHVDHSSVSINAGTLLTGGGDLTASRTLNVDEASIDHDALTNFVANEHVDHSTVDITTGNALTGGGDLTTTRTLAVDESAIDIANLAGVLADALIKSTGDNLSWNTDVNNDLILENDTDGTTLLTWDQDTGDITFEQLTGTPAFSTHDHSEAGLTTIPNAGLTNSAVTVAGNSVSLGGSTAIAHNDLSDDVTGAADVDNSGTTAVQDLTFDEHGHVTAVTSADVSGSGGSAIVLDLGDDDANESSDLTEIATTGDTNSIATEPTADKLLLDMSKNWPTADDVPDNAVDHDQTTNFVANEHVDHSTVSVSSGDGLSGGGDITASRTLSVDINGTTDLASPATGDELLLGDISNANAIRKADVASVVNLADHDQLTNFVANEHVDHSGVSISSGDGLSGGGDITSSRTLAVSLLTSGGLKFTTGELGVEPADFAGTLLSDDGSDNLQVDESSISHDGIDQSTVTANDHHQEPTAGSGITDEGTNQFGLDSVANGDTTLSSGSTTVDTGHSIDDTNEYTVFINPDDGADIAASLEEGATNYIIHLEENTTSVGNPGCRWRLIRYS